MTPCAGCCEEKDCPCVKRCDESYCAKHMAEEDARWNRIFRGSDTVRFLFMSDSQLAVEMDEARRLK